MMTGEEHRDLRGRDPLGRNRLWAGSALLLECLLLLRRMAQCIGKVLGSGVRRSELQSCLHCLLDFSILAYLSEPW